MLVAALFVCPAPSSGQARGKRFEGRTLAEALQILQRVGLRIVFTSTLVSPGLRVETEPRAPSARQQLDEMLQPHGLRAVEGPAGLLQVVRAGPPPAPPKAAPRPAGTTRETVGETIPAVHHEHVTVSEPKPRRPEPGILAESRLNRTQLARLEGALVDDPMRALNALPRVLAADDFRSEFAVRASPFRHVEVVIDGIATPSLMHAVPGRGASGSLSMLSSQVLDEAALRAGVYPQRHGDHLGAQLELSIREGSRSNVQSQVSFGGTSATLVGEGPLGGSRQGSWLAAVRQSYLEWPPARAQSGRTVFGFSDALAKIVYDVRPNQELSVLFLDGVSNADDEDIVALDRLGEGSSRTSLASVAWRATPGPSFVVEQQVHAVRRRLYNRHSISPIEERAFDEEVSYRASASRALSAGVLDAGAQVGRTASSYAPIDGEVAQAVGVRAYAATAFEGSSWQRSGFVHFVSRPFSGAAIATGLRVTGSTRLHRPVVSRWLMGEWAFRPGWKVGAAAGVSHQLPELRHLLGGRTVVALAAERATHVNVAVEQRLGGSVRWQATVFDRRERDVVREPDVYPRLLDNALVDADAPGRYVASLCGSSRGIELLVEHRPESGLAGWAAYSYGRARQTDVERGETFPADFDQRHAVTLSGQYRLSSRTSVGATFRAGSPLPLAGYFASRDGALFMAEQRNRVRLPAYARIDVRGDRRFRAAGRNITLFAEVLNLLDRRNLGPGAGHVHRSGGEAVGFTTPLIPRLATAGVVVDVFRSPR